MFSKDMLLCAPSFSAEQEGPCISAAAVHLGQVVAMEKQRFSFILSDILSNQFCLQHNFV